jgi:hypothetical protein
VSEVEGESNKKRLTAALAGEFTITVAILRYIKTAVILRGLKYWNKQSDSVKEETESEVVQ